MSGAAADLPEGSRAAVWARHWASGSPHSCAGSYGATYGGVVADFWRALLHEVPVGARTLDLASGSGALPRLFLQLAPQRLGTLDAVDLTPTPPPWFASPAAQAVRFHGGISIEALPFADASLDLVVSQYGLEYAGPAARAEARRVLAPGGRIALVLHHAQSRPVQLAALEMAHIDWLRGSLLPAAAAMAGPLARAATPQGRAALAADAAAHASRERFNAVQSALAQRIAAQGDGADVLFELRDAVGQALALAHRHGDGAAAAGALAQIDQHLADVHWRLRELRGCALDAEAMQALALALAAGQGTHRIGTLSEGEHLMGWTLRVGGG